MPVIEFHGVTKAYRRRFSKEQVVALSHVSFEVSAGEVCAFLGPNGAGKTTSISLLMGFLFADSGDIRVLGHEPGDVRCKERIGFLPENFAFYKYMTAPQLLRLHMALSGRAANNRVDRLIAELLAQVKLEGYEHLKIGKYSRGMVQRVGLAQALIGDPQLLVLDEPTSGLDPAGRRDVLELLRYLKSEGKTVFVSSHILPEVEQICDRVVIIDRGQLVRWAPLGELLAAGSRVELTVDRLPEDIESIAVERGAVVERGTEQVRIVVASADKREFAELLWNRGCDVMSMNPMKSTLQELFLKLVGDYEGAK
ncbi:MAG: ABC transporter ATP-binding protein [Bryobacteraceae bacterium]